MTPAVTTLAGPSGPLSAGGGERREPTGCTHEQTRIRERTDARGLPTFVRQCVECGIVVERIGGGHRGE